MALKYWDNSASEWKYVNSRGQKITVNSTAPSSPDVGDIWIDSDEYQTLPSSNSFVMNEVPTGSVNSSNTTFVTGSNYIAGSLEVYINGLKQAAAHVTETTPSSGTFDLDVAPTTGDVVDCTYQVAADPYSGNADTLDGEHLSGILAAIYPVGSIFVSGSSTMPTMISNIGTWARVQGKFIVGVDDGDGDFDLDDTGGAKTHTLDISEIPNKTGTITAHSSRSSFWTPSGVFSGSSMASTYSPPSASTGGANSINILQFNLGGGGGAHNNLPPYKAKYMWERTA